MPQITDVVDVTINVQSSGISRQGFNSLLVVGSSSDFGAGFSEHTVRKYTTYSSVGDDTDIVSGDLKNALQVAFAQSPAVPSVYVSRIDTAAVAEVRKLTFDVDFNAGNSIVVTLNGSALSADAFNTDQATTIADVASKITAQADYTATVTAAKEITITKGTAGTAFTITAAITGGSAVTATPSVVTPAQANGISSSDLSAIAANNNDWFGYTHVWKDAASAVTAAAFCAANKKYGFFRQNDFVNQNLNTHYASSWYTDTATNTGVAEFLDVAVASRLLSQTPGSYTAAFKSLELAGTTNVSTTNEVTLRSINANQYSSVAGKDITYNGKTAKGGFIDLYIGVIYLESRIQEDVFAQLSAVEKIPYTNAGVNLIVSSIQGRLNQSVDEGFLSSDPAPKTSAPLVGSISATDKSNRLLPNVTFEAITSGAIHTIKITGTIVA